MIKKTLHRIVIVWCIYGLVRVCIWVNPLLFWVANIIDPDYEWDKADWGEIFALWAITTVLILVVILIFVAIHAFSNWFFNEKKEN